MNEQARPLTGSDLEHARRRQADLLVQVSQTERLLLQEVDRLRAENTALTAKLAAVSGLHQRGDDGYCRGELAIWPCESAMKLGLHMAPELHKPRKVLGPYMGADKPQKVEWFCTTCFVPKSDRVPNGGVWEPWPCPAARALGLVQDREGQAAPEQMVCPGCGELLYLDPMNGWRNDTSGYTCKPPSTVHTDHIDLNRVGGEGHG